MAIEIEFNETIAEIIIASAINSELPKVPYLFRFKKSLSSNTFVEKIKSEELKLIKSRTVITRLKKGIIQMTLKRKNKLDFVQLIFLINKTDEKIPNKEIKPAIEEKSPLIFTRVNSWGIKITRNIQGNLNLKDLNLKSKIIENISER